MLKTTLIAAFSILAVTAGAFAQGSDSPVNILEYALSHPSDNARIAHPPELGDSVPRSVELKKPEGASAFAYFYYGGKPVIVDVRTRSVVKVEK